jgi:serine phosphatase RsbU (regulator of sigma subunit)
MPGSRPTDTFGPVRSRLLAIAEYLRARPIQLFLAGAFTIVLFLIPFHYVDLEQHFIGLPAALVSLTVAAGAVSGGPRVGGGLALVGGVAYDLIAISDRWLVQGATTAAVILVWLAAGLGVGLLGDRYRGQVARSLDQAHRSRDALDRVVGATPLFHARGGPPSVARAICDVAREAFDCDLVALFAIEGDRLRLLARSPYLRNNPERRVLEPSLELQEELAESLLPQFIPDVREPFGPLVPRAITADPEQVSALRAPVLLDEQPVALLAMSWAERRPEPERGELGVVQRFAEHAAVALAQAQRAQAQQEVAALYRRFQASLSPTVTVATDHIKVAPHYRPGESRMLLGGDFIDAVTRQNGSVAAVIGDVTGHGPDAAALGASLRAAWRALALRGASLQANMKTLNSLTLDESERAEQGELGLGLLATVCAVEIDAAGRRARFVNAGHPMPLLLADEVVQLDHSPGMMLGVEQYGDWAPHEVTLPDEWGLLLFSDGLMEARLEPGSRERLGLEGLRAAVTELWARRATAPADLRELVDRVQGGRERILEDDVTLLLLSHDGDGDRLEGSA